MLFCSLTGPPSQPKDAFRGDWDLVRWKLQISIFYDTDILWSHWLIWSILEKPMKRLDVFLWGIHLLCRDWGFMQPFLWNIVLGTQCLNSQSCMQIILNNGYCFKETILSTRHHSAPSPPPPNKYLSLSHSLVASQAV